MWSSSKVFARRIGSAHHKWAKYLTSILQSVLDLHSSYYLQGSFTFAENIQHLNLDPEAIILCFFDISSLFTNILVKEIIQICVGILYNNEIVPPPIPKAFFPEIATAATTSVEFNFNNTMNKRIGDVSKSSPLDPPLSNIFVGYYVEELFSRTSKPVLYFRYVDEAFAIFNVEYHYESFLTTISSQSPCLAFIYRRECRQIFSLWTFC